MDNQFFCAKENGKLHYPHTILTGFGFLASSIAWAIYDPYITKILNRLLNESAIITQWSVKLNEMFPALAKFAAASPFHFLRMKFEYHDFALMECMQVLSRLAPFERGEGEGSMLFSFR